MRQMFRKVFTVMACVLVWGVAEKAACPNAQASYGFNDALGTIGIGAGIGAVLGLSTVSFYEKPTAHLGNTLVGAGAGLIVGLGVAAYLLTTSSEDDEISPEELLPPENKPGGSGKGPDKNPVKAPKKEQGYRLSPQPLLSLASVPKTVNRMQPQQLLVAFNVLELRF